MKQEIDLIKLVAAIQSSERRMKPFVDTRRNMLKAYAGRRYGRGHSEVTPINTLWNTVHALIPSLVSANPQVMVSPRNKFMGTLKGEARKLELALNDELKLIHMRKIVADAVRDALFQLGIVKTGLCYEDDKPELYCCIVDFEDLILDTGAENIDQVSFIGNKFKVRRDFAIESGLYDVEKLKMISTVNIQIDDKKLSDFSKGPNFYEDYSDYIELADIFLPNEKRVVTIDANFTSANGYLRDVEYVGPICDGMGPYSVLGFSWMPKNAIPISPMSIIYDNHILLNKLATKAGRQAERSKDIVVGNKTASDDAKVIQDSDDGDIILLGDISKFNNLAFGGSNPKLYEQISFLTEQISRMAGNANLLAGVSADQKTATQSQILLGNAANLVGSRKQSVSDFVKNIVGKLAWYMLHSTKTYELEIDVPGTHAVPVKLDTTNLAGNFVDFQFDIDEYSLAPSTPEQKAAKVMTYVTQVILPLSQIGMMNGKVIDPTKLLDMISNLDNIPELNEIFVNITPEMAAQAAQMQGGVGPIASKGVVSQASPTQVQEGRPTQPSQPEPQPTEIK